jgi:hypothetical protein
MRVAITLCLAVALLAALPVAQSHDPVVTIPDPGFRPEGPRESQFLEDLGAASIAVYPTLVRRIERTAHSFPSQEQVIAFLNAQGIGHAVAAGRRLDPGRLNQQSQWLIFEAGLATLAGTVPDSHTSADYHLVLEILVPGDDAVFGIECYLVDREGENAFSFLLNAHHQVFAEAELVAGESQAARDAMIDKATGVAMRALAAQLASAQECAAPQQARAPVRLAADFLDDFETGLRSGADPDGIALGFSTFAGDNSRVRIATTKAHPAVPGHVKGNSVLQVDLDVTTWAGVLHTFADETLDHWIAYDLSDAKELSFWLYGRDSGTVLVVDVLDNRRRCPHMDDAERYSYQFVDDFSGWKLLSIPFAVMERKEIWNSAPDDGLGLSAVHGWAFAALETKGEATYFIDDVRLRRVPLLESIPQGLSRETDIWVPINELPMFGGYEKTAFQADADERFLQTVLPRFAGDRAAAAEYFAQAGWNLYYGDDRSGAIKRFNQAWLLNADNAHALWGFAVISRERGNVGDALRYYSMALDAGSEEPKLLQEYEGLRGSLPEE